MLKTLSAPQLPCANAETQGLTKFMTKILSEFSVRAAATTYDSKATSNLFSVK